MPVPTRKKLSAKAEQLILETELFKRRVQRDYPLFVQWSWPYIDPHKFIGGRHIDVLGEYLTAVRLGQITRLCVSMPPRLGKSSLITMQYPAWVWTTQPETQWMFASYGTDLSVDDHSVRRRRLIESEDYQAMWPDVRITSDSNQKWKYVNTRGGHMMATATGASTTGFGGDWLIIDDPQKASDAYSDAKTKEAIRFVRETLFTRLNDRNHARIIVVQQRLSDRDVTSELLADPDGGFTHLCLEAEADQHCTIFLPLSKTNWVRPKGEPLEPVRFGTEVLRQMKHDLGLAGYSAQMQQDPTPSGGAIFNPSNARYYTETPVFEQKIQSVDCSFKDTSTSDFVCIQVWGFAGARSYLIDFCLERLGLTATKAQIGAFQQKHHCHAVLIEDKANGSAAIEALRTAYNVIPIQPEGGKESRAWACQPTWEAGNIYLPDVNHPLHKEKDWVPKLVSNLSKFRGEGSLKHDDDIDAFTQAINWRRKNTLGIIGWYREQAEERAQKDGVSDEKEGQREHMEKQVGMSLQKLAIGLDTPRCPACGGLTFITRGLPDGSEQKICMTCSSQAKCAWCKQVDGHAPHCSAQGSAK